MRSAQKSGIPWGKSAGVHALDGGAGRLASPPMTNLLRATSTRSRQRSGWIPYGLSASLVLVVATASFLPRDQEVSDGLRNGLRAGAASVHEALGTVGEVGAEMWSALCDPAALLRAIGGGLAPWPSEQ